MALRLQFNVVVYMRAEHRHRVSFFLNSLVVRTRSGLTKLLSNFEVIPLRQDNSKLNRTGLDCTGQTGQAKGKIMNRNLLLFRWDYQKFLLEQDSGLDLYF